MWRYKTYMTANEVCRFVNNSNVDVKQIIYGGNRYVVFYTDMG